MKEKAIFIPSQISSLYERPQQITHRYGACPSFSNKHCRGISLPFTFKATGRGADRCKKMISGITATERFNYIKYSPWSPCSHNKKRFTQIHYRIMGNNPV